MLHLQQILKQAMRIKRFDVLSLAFLFFILLSLTLAMIALVRSIPVG